MSADWLRIITAHVEWKLRLQKFLDGTSTETLDPAVIAVDNRCELGKWIYSVGTSFKNSTNYTTVKESHAHFHKVAATIVSHHLHGDTQAAQSLLNGDYSQLSDTLKKNILKLRSEAER
jgi:hypothetical protein